MKTIPLRPNRLRFLEYHLNYENLNHASLSKALHLRHRQTCMSFFKQMKRLYASSTQYVRMRAFRWGCCRVTMEAYLTPAVRYSMIWLRRVKEPKLLCVNPFRPVLCRIRIALSSYIVRERVRSLLFYPNNPVSTIIVIHYSSTQSGNSRLSLKRIQWLTQHKQCQRQWYL